MSELEKLAELGRRRAALLAELERVTAEVEAAAVAAVVAKAPKFYVARDAGVTRRTLDKWLRERGVSS